MHEFALMNHLLQAVEGKAQELGADRVLAINLVVGDRSSIVDDSGWTPAWLFYFDMLTPGTVVEGAALNMRRVPSRFYCSACDQTFEPAHDFRCPHCSAIGVMTDEGGEFLLESIEIERD